MKKTLRRISALFLALCMIMAMGITAFAEDPNGSTEGQASTTLEDRTATLKITGIKEKVTVKLYQIGTPEYNTKKDTFVKFNYVNPINVKGTDDKIAVPFTPTKPTMTEINTIANGIIANPATVAAIAIDGATKEVAGTKDTAADYEYDAKAGVYIAIITGGENTYNPILLAVSYDSKGDLSAGNIPVNSMYKDIAVAKSSEPTIDKEITGGTTADVDDKNNAKPTVSVGDIVSYKVTPTLPSYPTNAVNKTVYITDTMSAGLDFDFTSLNVKLTGAEVTKFTSDDGNTVTFKVDDKTIATAKKVENGFRLSFVYDEVNGKSPVVEYQARVNANAIVGSAGNANDVEYFYSNQPNTGSTYEDLNKKPQEGNGLKKKEDKETVYTYEIAFKKTDENDAALAGATFGIYKDKDCKKLVDIVESNSEGIARSSQVENGTYYVKEISAPAGYSLNTEVKSIEAKWTSVTSTVTHTATTTTYTSDSSKAKSTDQVGWLKDDVFYSMETYTTETAKTAGAVPAYVEKENTTTSTSITTEQGAGAGVVDLGTIKNTKLSSLPSTGGIGTYIFTFVGVMIMVVAGGLYFVSRRKRA